MEVACKLRELAQTVPGVEAYCWRAYADALEIIPYTLSENAGLNPIATVTELRNRHATGETNTGINVRKVKMIKSFVFWKGNWAFLHIFKGRVTNMNEENVLQPLLVSVSALTLATETVRSILKIDDIVISFLISQ